MESEKLTLAHYKLEFLFIIIIIIILWLMCEVIGKIDGFVKLFFWP